MTLLLLLVALAATPQVAPTIKVAFDGDTVIVTARPPEGRTVKGIGVRRASEKKPRAPRDTEPTGKQGVRAFFEHPHTLFDVIVTLDDGTVHRLKDQDQRAYTVKPFLGDVLPVRPLPSPPY